MICISRFDSLYLLKYLLVSGTPMGRTLLWSVRKVGNLLEIHSRRLSVSIE